jgi:hypothetical protein
MNLNTIISFLPCLGKAKKEGKKKLKMYPGFEVLSRVENLPTFQIPIL